MSIKLGKSNNWGSRTGKTCSHSDLTDIEKKLVHSGLSSDLLQAIATNDASLKQAAQNILNKKNLFLKKSHTSKAKKIYTTSLGTLYQGDCLVVLSNLRDNSLDFIFADPPFNLSKNYGKGISDSLPDEEYFLWCTAWLNLCVKKLKPGGSFFIYNIPKWNIRIASHLEKFLNFKHWIAIDSTMSMPIAGRLYPSHYSLLYFVKGDKPNTFAPPRMPIQTCVKCGAEQKSYGGYKRKLNPEGISLKDVWLDIPPVRHSKFKNRDANELHLKLLDRVIEMSTKEGDLIFDPFGGSGSTFAVAELKGRRWIGAELGTCAPIIKRIKSPKVDKEILKEIQQNSNTLFTDKALELRFKSAIGIKDFVVSDEQISRVLSK